MNSALKVTSVFALLCCGLPGALCAAEYRVERVDHAAPTDGVAAEIHQRLSKTGIRVIEGDSRTVCELWLVNKLPVVDGFQPTPQRLYPFESGDLIGVAALPRGGSDFRDQDLSEGVYTLRYELQPIDGNHIGTSPTRDFLLLVQAKEDTSPEPMDSEKLTELSATAAGSLHPAMWCLQNVDDDADAATIRQLPGRDWWALRLVGQAAEGGKKVPIDLVVVGQANE